MWLFLLALLFAGLLRVRASRDQVPGINYDGEVPTCNVDVEYDLTIMKVRIVNRWTALASLAPVHLRVA